MDERNGGAFHPVADRCGNPYLADIAGLIARHAPRAARFLEWGSGEGTAILCEAASLQAEPFVLSIDDDAAHQLSVARRLPLAPYLHFRTLAPHNPPAAPGDGTAHERYPSYAAYPALLDRDFDVVVIDGRRRCACALVAAQILAEDGIVILPHHRRAHDAPLLALFDVVAEDSHCAVLRPRREMPRRERPPRDDERRAIIVTAKHAKALRELSVSRPLTEAYARDIGADLHVVGADCDLPPQRLKSAAYEVALGYDRILLIDADVLIRRGAPDVFAMVPRDRIGAFPEGMFFPYAEHARTVNELYGLDPKLTAGDYINSGVLVLSKPHYEILRSLRDDLLFAHPCFDQAHINAKRHAAGFELMPMSVDFNYIPLPGFFPDDWRFAFFYHCAGTLKARHHPASVWSDPAGDRRTFVQVPAAASIARYVRLRQAAEQMCGRDVVFIDPSDLNYLAAAFPLLDGDNGLVAYFPGGKATDAPVMATFGPYIALEPGAWRLEFFDSADRPFVYAGAEIDVIAEIATRSLLPLQPWPETGRVDFEVPTPMENVEIRIYRPAAAAALAYMRLERLRAG